MIAYQLFSAALTPTNEQPPKYEISAGGTSYPGTHAPKSRPFTSMPTGPATRGVCYFDAAGMIHLAEAYETF